MLNKKIISGLLACTFTLGLCAFSPIASNSKASFLSSGQPVAGGVGTVDLSIANEGRIIKMLQSKGQIPAGATQDQIETIYNEYLKSMENDYNMNPSELTKEEKILLHEATANEPQKKPAVRTPGKIVPATKRTWDGTVKHDKILVVLAGFSDLKYGNITAEESDMYYADKMQYEQQHYQDMIFGSDGYVLPNGKKALSVKQYYEQQSGGSYTIDGTVLGWYNASNPAAYYGADAGTNHNIRAKNFVLEAVQAAGLSVGRQLADYDVEDPNDWDADGNLNEPDGVVDHLMIVHAGVGQEAGGGVLGTDAIWSHSSSLGGYYSTKTTSNSTRFGGVLAANAYVIMPEDGASGVFAHEFGHNLGLPDDYDTNYTGKGEPISSWSIMANGSWAGTIPGTEPTGFNPDAKIFFQNTYGGNWSHGTEIDIKDVPKSGVRYILDQASKKGNNNDFVKVNIPGEGIYVNTPTSGTKEYFSGNANKLDNYMTATVDLKGKTSAKLQFKTWYGIETDWDYAYVEVQGEDGQWANLQGNITTTVPGKHNLGNGITGKSNGWIDAEFDLSKYAGQKITLAFEYITDEAESWGGFYVDDINVLADGTSVFNDNADGISKFEMTRFTISDGYFYPSRYYVLEWRSQFGTDSGLAHLNKLNNIMSYSPGLVIWFVDSAYTDNWVGLHPGKGRIGVVDADQRLNMWKYDDGVTPDSVGSTQYQMNDAAFCQKDSQPVFLNFSAAYGRTLTDNNTSAINEFNDANSYINPLIPDAGKMLPTFGLRIIVNGQAKDYSNGTIQIKKN